MKKRVFIIIATICMSLSACIPSSHLSKVISVSDLNGVVLHRIVGPSELELFNSEWNNKKQVLVKKMPEFEFIITIPENKKSSEWLYSKGGYVMLKDSKKGVIYRADLSIIEE